jgi:hypothetical protein
MRRLQSLSEAGAITVIEKAGDAPESRPRWLAHIQLDV